jgi:hypothetical protein
MNPPRFMINYDTIAVDVQSAQQHISFPVRIPPWLPPGYELSPTVQVLSKEPRVIGEIPEGFDLSMFHTPEFINFIANAPDDPTQKNGLSLSLQRELPNAMPLPPSDDYALAEALVAGKRAQIVRHKQARLFKPDEGTLSATPVAFVSTCISCVVDEIEYSVTKNGDQVPDETLIQILTAWITQAT